MRERIMESLKQAQKARDPRRTSTLRLVTSAIKDKDIELRGAGKEQGGDEEIVAILQKMVKQREESVTVYAQGNREDLAAAEREEIAILSEFLPAMMSEPEVDAAIAAAIASTGAAEPKDMGKVIAQLKADHPGRIDFAKASGRVKAALS